jgi:Fe2+ or Zn2+ uptake regulation protein
MNTPDMDVVLRAVEDARRVLREYIEPQPRDAVSTVDRLLTILDRQDLVHALNRLHRGRVIRLVE